MSKKVSDISAGETPPSNRLERRQSPTGPGFSERHGVLAVADSGQAALAMQISIHYQPGPTAAFACVVFRDGEVPVIIVESEMAVPANHWEFRTSGLWVDHVCETPFVHWSYGLEAFGLAIDDPLEMLGRGYGHRVPIGWELEFESTPDRYEMPSPQHHRQAGIFHGLLLFAEGAQSFDGTAMRYHRWGPPAPEQDMPIAAITGRVASNDHPVEVALPAEDGVWWVARTEVGVDARFSAEAPQKPPR